MTNKGKKSVTNICIEIETFKFWSDKQEDRKGQNEKLLRD